MDGSARIVVGPGPQRSALEVAASAPPFSIRRCGGRVLVAASAAGPVGGDHLRLDLTVRPNARADIGSVGAMSVHPGPRGDASSLITTCTVGAGAHLAWWAEPTVSIVGSDHTTRTVVDVADDATCRIVEEVSLGRTGEAPGRLHLALHVTRGGRPVVRHAETFGDSPGPTPSLVSVGGARHVLSAVLVGVDAGVSRTVVTDECRAAWLPMAADVAVVLAVGSDRPVVRFTLADLAPELTAPGASSETRYR